MLKALLKKQLLELNKFYFQNKKTGELRSKRSAILFIGLYALLFIAVSFVFVGLGSLLSPLLESSAAWLYYCLMGLVAVLYGCFGSVFNTYAGLYHAQDNDLLLAMPIKPSQILLVRMVGVFAMSLLYSAMVSIPAAVIRITSHGVSAGAVVADILLVPVIAVFVTVISSALGWVVAWLSSKFKNKSILTVVFALIVMGAYFYFCSNSFNTIQSLVTNAENVSRVMRTWFIPFYIIGKAGEGSLLHFLLFLLLTAVLLLLAWYVLSRSFVSIVTKKESAPKKVYTAKTDKAQSIRKALLRKELRRFTASPTYMLNGGLGCVFMPLAAVILFIKAPVVRETVGRLMAETPDFIGFLPVVGAMAVCMIASMNIISAPSVSLEGKQIWIAQTLPVKTSEILRAKLQLHRVLTAPPALLCVLAFALAISTDFSTVVMMLACVYAFILFTSALGLILNLKNPNLTWTNETAPVKQSFAVFISMFGGWVISIGLVALYYPLRNILAGFQYLTACLIVLVLATRYMERWIGTKGAEIFEEL